MTFSVRNGIMHIVYKIHFRIQYSKYCALLGAVARRTMKNIFVKALAKINLGLDVVRRREDGYHEVRMVMQTIHLFDRLEITKNTSGKITMSTTYLFYRLMRTIWYIRRHSC